MPPYRPASEETQPQRTADVLTREVPFVHAMDFVGACAVFAEVIEKENPGIVFFPQRGAGPIEWTTEVLMEASGKRLPVFSDLPIGTHISINGDKPEHTSGIRPNQKKALIEQTFDDLLEAGLYVPGQSGVMLIDEVQKGGTISQASRLIRQTMYKHGDTGILTVVAAQDSRNKMLGDDRTEAYRKLVANERAGFKTTTVPTAMFMVDRHQFLDEILRTSDGKEVSLDDFIMRDNETARRAFRTLARVFVDPERALTELEELRKHELTRDLGTTVLQTEILEALTDPVPITNGKHATEEHLFGWWTQFARSVQNKRAGSNIQVEPLEPVQ